MSTLRINKYFLTVRLMKWVILSSLIILCLIFIIPFIIGSFNTDNNGKKKPREVSISKVVQSIAEGTRLYGQDSKNQAFEIQAKEIIQQSNREVEMDKVYASQVLKDEKLVSIISDKALLDQKNNTVKMNGNVMIFYDDLYTLSAQQAEVNYNNSTVEGGSLVVLNTKFGKIESSQFEVKENYQDVRFFGNRVKTTLYGNKNESE